MEFSHRRRSGLELQYDVSISGDYYKISRDGRALKTARFPILAAGNVSLLEFVAATAIADIDGLRDMPEE